jgi:uncharacterized protein YkwD
VSSTHRRPTYRRAPLYLEQLEDRLVPTGLVPTALDQLMLEELNAARANPTAYGQSIGVDLSSVAPSQPLAFDPLLIAAAQGHSQDMNDNAYFDHVSPSGQDPGARITAQGYSWTSWGESIAAGYATPASALSALIIDSGVPDLGHRVQLLAMTQVFQTQSEVGIGMVLNGSGPYSDYYTIDTAEPQSGGPFLTGVVYNDANGNGQYDVGEGLGGVTIAVQGAGSTTTWASGGYTLQLNPGTYTVTASGGGLATPFSEVVTIGSQNVQLNITPNSQAAQQANQAFVSQLYQSMLKRNPSPTELNSFSSALTDGTTTQAQLTTMVRTSQEYRQVCTTWLTQVYQDNLGRPIGSSELASWLSWLETTGTPDEAAATILNSPEYHQRQWTGWVQAVYQTYLDRSAGSSEVAMWIGDFKAGWTEADLVSAVVLSGEFQSRVGASNSQFVGALYQDMLGRTGSTTEIDGWVGALQTGSSRASVVAGFLGSYEYQWRADTLWGATLYQSLLGRPADSNELSAMATALMSGVPYEAIDLSVVDSLEYYAHAAG